MSEAVRLQYDRQARVILTQRERSGLPTADLARFHNWVKRQLLRFNCRAGSVLDLGCGRGGDLHKFQAAQVRYVLGIDISAASIEQARTRYREQPADIWGFEFDTAVFDMCSACNELSRLLSSHPVDCVSCQFALHCKPHNCDLVLC